jgi:hypothetical protein
MARILFSLHGARDVPDAEARLVPLDSVALSMKAARAHTDASLIRRSA